MTQADQKKKGKNSPQQGVQLEQIKQNRRHVLLIAQAALLAALSFVGFAFFRIDIPVGIEKTAFHFGNVFLILAALLIGGLWGGLAGAVGMTIADLTSGYATSAPATFVLKLGIGLIVGLVAERILHLSRETEPRRMLWKTAVSASAGILFNVIADPIVRYLFKRFIFALPADIAKAWAKIGALTTLVNGLVAIVAVTIFYLALRPALAKSKLLIER